MSSPASIRKHPIHPMLVTLPIGLWVFSFISQLVFLGGGAPGWGSAAFYAAGVGICGAVAAAIPGLIDLLSLPRASRAWRIGLFHMGVNVLGLVLWAISFGLMGGGVGIAGAPFVLSMLGLASIGVGGWLGGELVFVHGVGVTPGADVETRPTTLPRDDHMQPPSERRAA